MGWMIQINCISFCLCSSLGRLTSEPQSDEDEGEGWEAGVIVVGCDEGKEDRELYYLENSYQNKTSSLRVKATYRLRRREYMTALLKAQMMLVVIYCSHCTIYQVKRMKDCSDRVGGRIYIIRNHRG
jgi:hypothetical protein